MDFLEFMEIHEKLCNEYLYCRDCPLVKFSPVLSNKTGACIEHIISTHENQYEAVEILKRWKNELEVK